MKMKLLCLALSLVLLLPMLFACGGEGDATTPAGTTAGGGGDSTTAPTVTGPLVDRIDLSGTTLRIVQNVELYRDLAESGAYSPMLFSRGPDEAEYEQYATNAVFAEVYNRNSEIYEKTGLTVEFTPVTYERDGKIIQAQLESYALADLEDAPDIVSHVMHHITKAGILGYLYNAYEDEMGPNYFDFTHESWYLDMMKQESWSDDTIYTLCGDYWIEIVRGATPVLVNISMYDDLFAVEGGIENLYRDIDDGYWCLDDMFDRAQVAYEGKVGGGFNPESTYGLISNSFTFMHLVRTSGLHPTEYGEDGKLRLAGAETLNEIHDFIDKMIAWQQDDSVWFNYDKMLPKEEGCIHKFAAGGSLFTLGNFVGTMEGALIQDADDIYGVLPIPKGEYDDLGPVYKTECLSANAGGIVISSDQFSACTAYLQMQTEGSREVMRLYFEEGLQLKNNMANSVGQVRMLNYVREGIMRTDGRKLAEPTDLEGFVEYNNIIRNCVLSGTNTFSSDWEAGREAREQAMREAYENFGRGQN